MPGINTPDDLVVLVAGKALQHPAGKHFVAVEFPVMRPDFPGHRSCLYRKDGTQKGWQSKPCETNGEPENDAKGW